VIEKNQTKASQGFYIKRETRKGTCITGNSEIKYEMPGKAQIDSIHGLWALYEPIQADKIARAKGSDRSVGAKREPGQ